MLYLTPDNYIEINKIKFLLNVNENISFIKRLKKSIKDDEEIDTEQVSERRKNSLILLDKKAILCNVNSKTLFERIEKNEVNYKSMFLDISYGNYISLKNVLLITDYETQPIKTIVSDLKEKESIKLFNFTGPRKTKSVIFTIHGEVILSAIESTTLYKRISAKENQLFHSVGNDSYVNDRHIHLVTNRAFNHIRTKIKAVEKISSKHVLKVSGPDKAKTAIFCENNYIILSKVNPETIKRKIEN